MSLTKDLVGAECGGVNPLMRLTGHMSQDQSRRQDGFRQPIGVALPNRGITQEEQLANEFLYEQTNRRQMVPQSFEMAGLLQELREMDEAAVYKQSAPQRAPAVAELATHANWAQQFLANEKSQMASAAADFDTVAPQITHTNRPALMGGPMMPHPHMMNSRLHMVHQQHWESKPPLSKEQAEVWTKPFQEPDELVKTARELHDGVTDPKLKNSKFMQFVKDIADEEVTVQGNDVTRSSNSSNVEEWVSQFQQTSNAEKGDDHQKSLSDKWAEELKTGSTKPADEDFWKVLEEQWNDLAKEEGHPWLDYEETEPYMVYKFEEGNPLINHENPFSEGLKRLAHGDIPNATLYFEAAVQKDANHMEAWQYLGTTQAENERDPHAVAALKRCLHLHPGNLTALMALAACYTNECMQTHALQTLVEWVKQHPKYHSLVPEGTESTRSVSSFMSRELHDKVKNYLFGAIKMSAGDIDPDVQCAMGVLFNLSGEYDKAVDCFRTALQVTPKDALLWNRLGATLANSHRSEEAVDAYRNALSISPGFIRCRFNLGIACFNLHAYREAVEHYLQALNMQKQGKGPKGENSIMSDNIWSTLRGTIALTGRTDLFNECETRDLEALNRAFNITT